VGPDNPYGETKAASERDIAGRAGLRGVALRYFNASGAHPDGSMGEDHRPETHLLPLLLAATARRPLKLFGTDYPTPDGTAIRDYVHVWDLAVAHGAALDHLIEGGTSQVINLGCGTGYSVRQVIEAAARVTGEEPPVTTSPRRAGDVARLVASRERAENVLGWTPEHDLDDIVRDAWRWHCAHPNGYRG